MTHTVFTTPKPSLYDWALYIREEAAKGQFLSAGDYKKNAQDTARKK